MNILSSLNQKQQEAVSVIKGPVLVIAGPGSGKTRCLTHRIAYLIQNNISAHNILAVTFTNKAAGEMRERVKKIINLSSQQIPDIGTFHAVCAKILRHEIDKLGYQSSFVIYDDSDRTSLIKKIIKELAINQNQFKPNIAKNIISRAKDELIDERLYAKQAADYYPQNIAKIYSAYQEAMKKANALDFDDLIMLTVKIFKKYPEVLKKYQNKWQYILVDEAHDINTSQYTFANLLAQEHQNLWLISDMDQNIYSWRGADFRNILKFEKDYPEVKTIALEQNYRSTKNILQASHAIISKNKQRKEKKLWTDNPTGESITLVRSDSEEEEGYFLTDEITNLIRSKKYNLSDFTVLYRTNAQSRSVEEAFLKAGFPYKIIGTVRFYDRKEIKDILAYLKFIQNSNDLVSMERIMKIPPRKKFLDFADELREKSNKIVLTDFIKELIDRINYKNYLHKFSKSSQEAENRIENIKELLSVAMKYDKLEDFLEEASLLSSSDEIKTNKNVVNLMTMHCAKGLEFPVVFVVGCEEGIFPHSRSQFDPDQLEEERRLCYVAITRAKHKAYLTFTNRRKLYGQIMANPPSRFIGDIPEELIDYYDNCG